MKQFDPSTAGKRLRHSPRQHGRNPDWNDAAQRWKTLEEYAGDTLSPCQLQAAAACPRLDCCAEAGQPCRDARGKYMPESPHPERRTAAGAYLVKAGWKLS